MSGATIGGVVGAVVGSFIPGVGTQLGWMIGSAIGGYVDPEQISQFGPRLTDATQQAARDGLPIPYGYGTFPCAGNIIWCGPVVEHVDESTDDGKGSGVETTTTTYSYTRSYAIGICQGEIAGLLVIKRNGKIVFDARTDAELTSLGYTAAQIQEARAAAASANLRFVVYTGSETQTADPTIEAHEGVGNVPGHRGLAYIVVTDDDVTELRGAVPQYEFVVAVDGTSQDLPEDYHAKLYGGSPFPFDTNNTSLRDPRKAGATYQYSAGGSPPVWRDTVGEALDDAAAALGNDINGQPKLIESPQLMGWCPAGFDVADGGIGTDLEFAPWDDGVSDANGRTTVTLAYSRHPFSAELEAFEAVYFGAYEACSSIPEPTWCRVTRDTEERFHSGVVVSSASTLTGFSGNPLTCGAVTGDGVGAGSFYYYADVLILCRAIVDCEGVPDGYVELPDAPGYYVTPDGSIDHHGNCEAEAGTYKQLSVLNVTSGTDHQPFITRPCGPVLESTHADYDSQAYWDAAYAAAVADGILPEGLTYSSTGTGVAGEFYPVEVSSVCGCAQDVSAIELDTVLLADIVAAEFQRVGLTSDDYDVSQLTDEVLGYRVLPNGSGVDASLGPLMQAYYFDIAEWDGKLRCIKRGGASSLSLTMDDLAERDGEAIEWTRVQEAELLRLQTVAYIDPRAGYTPTTQKWERRAGTVQAKGEAAVEVPITATADTAAGIAKKRGLIAWAETEKAKLSLPYRRAKVTPTDVLTLTDADGEAHRLRVGQIEDDSGVRLLEVTKERGNVYGATATGVNPNNPTAPSGGLIGPTILYAMNLPRLRSQDNKPGAYVAVTGLLPGWKGADIYVSADGGVSEQFALRIMSRATMGRLVSAIDADDEPITVSLYDGRSVSSITDDQLATRQNGFAITTDGTSEVGQFQTAAENGDNYDLTDTLRGQMGTTAASHLSGDAFVLLDQSVFFMPLDISLAGKTLILRAVSIGTANDDNATISFVFDPQFTGPATTEFYTNAGGEKYTNAAGDYYYRE